MFYGPSLCCYLLLWLVHFHFVVICYLFFLVSCMVVSLFVMMLFCLLCLFVVFSITFELVLTFMNRSPIWTFSVVIQHLLTHSFDIAVWFKTCLILNSIWVSTVRGILPLVMWYEFILFWQWVEKREKGRREWNEMTRKCLFWVQGIPVVGPRCLKLFVSSSLIVSVILLFLLVP